MASPKYMSRLIAAIRTLFKEQPAPTEDEVKRVVRTISASEAGQASGERRRAAKEGEGEGDAADVAAADGATAVTLLDWPTASLSERERMIREELRARFGTGTGLVDVWDDHLVFFTGDLYMMEGTDRLHFYEMSFTVKGGAIEFGDRTEVEETRSFTPVNAGDAGAQVQFASHFAVPGKTGGRALPANVSKLAEKEQRQWAEIWNSAYDAAKKDGKAEGDAVAAAFATANGVVLKKGKASGAVAAADNSASVYGLAVVRLADSAAAGLPEWIQIHKVGEWAVEHGSAGKIVLTDADADQMIENFERNVLRRIVPLQEGHDPEAPSLGRITELRRGQPEQGKIDGPEPSGDGGIIYARVKYNQAGTAALTDERFYYVSPGYDRDYQDKEEGGPFHGFVLKHVAALNDPFLRLRSIQGEDCPEPVLLSDGIGTQQQRRDDGMTQQQAAANLGSGSGSGATTVTLEDMRRLEAQLADERTRREATEAVLMADRRERYEQGVEARIEQAKADGVAPAVANIVKAVMLASSPSDASTVKLADGAADPDANVHTAMVALLDQLPRLQFGGFTRPVETRPANASLAQLDDAAAKQVAQQIVALGGGAALSNEKANL